MVHGMMDWRLSEVVTGPLFHSDNAESFRGAAVVADQGAAQALRAVGGCDLMMARIGALTLIQLEEDDAEQSKRVVVEWERSHSLGLTTRKTSTGNRKNNSRPVKIVFLLTDFLWGKEELIGSILSGNFTSEWVTAHVLCSVSSKAHGTSPNAKPSVGAPLDFTAFALKLQNLARPNAAEVKVKHIHWGLKLHLDSLSIESGARIMGVFTLANRRLSSLFPVTLNRLGLQFLGDLDHVDGNQDLPDESKVDVKLAARTLASALHDQFGLDVTRGCWAAGFTSRLLGNALLDMSEQDELARQNRRHEQLATGGGLTVEQGESTLSGAQKPAKLILVDRSIDLVTALSEASAPEAQHIHNLLSDPKQQSVSEDDELEKTLDGARLAIESRLGRLTLEHASNPSANDLLASLITGGDARASSSRLANFLNDENAQALGKDLGSGGAALLTSLARALASDPCAFERLAGYQTVAACGLSRLERARLEPLHALDRIIMSSASGPEPAHCLLPLVDLLTRGGTPMSRILRLTLLGYSIVGSCPEGLASSEAAGITEALDQALKQALANANPNDEIWAAIAQCDIAHVLRVLHEQGGSKQNRVPDRGIGLDSESLLGFAIARGLESKSSPLIPLGESALQATAKDLGNLLKQGLGVFGFGAKASGQSAQDDASGAAGRNEAAKQKPCLKIADGDILVIFVTGGITFSEIRDVVRAVEQSGKTVQLLFGGTCIASPAQVTYRSFQTVYAPRLVKKKSSKERAFDAQPSTFNKGSRSQENALPVKSKDFANLF